MGLLGGNPDSSSGRSADPVVDGAMSAQMDAALQRADGSGAILHAAAPRERGTREPAPPECIHTGKDRCAEAARQARRLIASANELLTLAAELEEVARRGDPSAGREYRPPVALPEGGTLLEDDVRWLRHARRTYRNRRGRSAVFGDESLFGEPAWDLMLDLFIAAKERKRVPVTSACIGAAVPTTTALRWLAVLEERGLVLREADPSDARRVFVRLSADAYGKMVAYFVRAAVGDAEDTIEAARAGRAMERAWR